MAIDFSPEALRARFEELTAANEAITADLQPLRDELADLTAGDTKLSVRNAIARERAIREQIKAFQEQLFPIEMERAACARALGGRTGA